MIVSRETRLGSRSAIGIKAAATRKRINDARVSRLEEALRKLRWPARLAEAKLRYRISDQDRVRLRADLTEALALADTVLPPKLDPKEPL